MMLQRACDHISVDMAEFVRVVCKYAAQEILKHTED